MFNLAAGVHLLFLALLVPKADAFACENNTICEENLWPGSECLNNKCTNAFQSGCLRSLLTGDESKNAANDDLRDLRNYITSRKRVCNSEDKTGSEVCDADEHGYSEVRLFTQNWESAMVTVWMLQIIYSEILGVPSTIELGKKGLDMNFYSPTNEMDYGASNTYDHIKNADEAGGDCTVYKKNNQEALQDDTVEYIPCAHAVPEFWFDNQELYDLQDQEIASPSQFSGAIGDQSWYITKNTLVRDPSMGVYFGLQGEKNRQKLAETFKRPTSWLDYCIEVSADKCVTDDGVATRYPSDDDEKDMYFKAGEYTGHFRLTEKNDCSRTEPCTGHIMNYPCGWTSYIMAQTYHLGIALESDGPEENGGYSYSQMVQIWKAAKETKSDVIGIWWTPDATLIEFEGTDSELIPVFLPTPTQECINNRVDLSFQCDPDATVAERYGDLKGSCGEPPAGIKKVTGENMKSRIETNDEPRARMSPAYSFFQHFSVTDLQVNEILVEWVNRKKDSFDLRLATCQWMANNLDFVQKALPPTHPREFVSAKTQKMPAIAIFATTVSVISILVVVCATLLICQKQYKHAGTVAKISQFEFVLLLLVGLFMVAVGSLTLSTEPSSGSCVASAWLVTVGYTMQLGPLLVKISVIVSILAASKKLKRVVINLKTLLAKSFGLGALGAIFCLVWTLIDPPREREDLKLTGNTNEFGATMVEVSYYCDSDSSMWYMISFVWQSLLLIAASALVYQMRAAPKQVNDSMQLALMIYSSSVFVMLRIIVFILVRSLPEGQLSKATFQQTRSLFCSLDTIANVCIYFPKFLQKEKENERSFSTSYEGEKQSTVVGFKDED